MSDLRKHTDGLFEKWILKDDLISIKLMEGNYSVSAADVVRVEFKKKSVIDISNKKM